jgi:hypothetical protein
LKLEVYSFIFTDVPVSTALGLASETPDSNWVVSYRSGQATGAVVANVAGWSQFSSYANWITPPMIENTAPAGNYTFTTSFDLVKFDPAKYFLNAEISSDDALLEVKLNGANIALIPSACPTSTFQCITPYEFNGKFVSGTNTLSFTVANDDNHSKSNPVGLYVQFSV